MDPVTFGEWLRKSRDELRLTRREFSDRVGCSVAMLRKMEGDERRPSSQIAALIARSLNVLAEDRPTVIKVARGELSVDHLSAITQRMKNPSAPPAQAPGRINLPIPPTPLIGRQEELEKLNQLLRDSQCRLLTLAGPGGIGKTRLAIEAASQVQDYFVDGVYFVPLALINSSRFIVPVIAEAVGFAFQREGTVEPRLQLFHYLQAKQAILVIDNLEHLLAEPEMDLWPELLEAAPQVVLLVTSRESLGLHDEWVYEVQGLPVPESGDSEITTQGTAVELFLQRARRAHVQFDPTTHDYPAIVRICQLVGGMPLGIELAATWVRTLSCTEIVIEIERGLDFLRVSARDLPARHRSLRAIFEHSWELLSEEEQGVLLRLSVFRGGFRRDAAEKVAGASLSTLSGLITKSLVRRSGADRYDLHELIRQYASERFSDQTEERTQVQARHSLYFLDAFGSEDIPLRSSAQRESLARLTIEMDNFRIAWDWAVTHHEFDAIEQMLRAFATFFDNRGWFQEGLELLGRAANALQAESEKSLPGRGDLVALGHLLACTGLLGFRIAMNQQAKEMLERSIEILRPLDEPRVLVEAVTFLGIVMTLQGEQPRALELFSEGLEIAEKIGDQWFAALCLTEQIGIDMMMGKSGNAFERLQLVVADWRAIGDPRFTAFGLNFLSLGAYNLGRFDEARSALEESLALNLSVGDRWGLGSAYRGLGLVAQAQGDHIQALDTFEKSLAILTELGSRWDMARVLAEMGRSAFALGNDFQAERLWYDSLRIASETQATVIGVEAVVGIANLFTKRGNHEVALELVLIVLGQPACIQETKDRAVQLVSQIENFLTPQEMAAVRQRAVERTFVAITEELLEQAGMP